MKEKLTDWINKNYRRSAQPLYAWVDAADLLSFIKTLDTPTQLTQDTESWLSDFRQSFWQMYTGYPQGTFSVRIEEWIKQKKQEWESAIEHTAQIRAYETLKQARMQGAEDLAKKLIKWADDNTGLGGDMAYGEFLEYLEASKKV